MRRMSLATVTSFGLLLVGLFVAWWWLTWHALAVGFPSTVAWPLWVKAVLTLNFLALTGTGLKFGTRQSP